MSSSKTMAIGRHLVDVPDDAVIVPQWRFNNSPLAFRDDIRTDVAYDAMINQREQALRAAPHEQYGSLFVQRVDHSAHRGVTLVSWNRPGGTIMYQFDSYFRIGGRTLSYLMRVSNDRRDSQLKLCAEIADRLRPVDDASVPQRKGFVAGSVILEDTRFNRESWSLTIKLPNKPDAWIQVSAFAQYRVEPSLRKRAGGLLTSLLGSIAGMHQLRNRARPVGPIEADEILIAGTEKGKRLYAFKWEASGKAHSLAEPQLNAELDVIESVYKTNNESFASDEEALELWDRLIDSIRLRPGAV
ncbi:hypothetical protein D9X30_2359 [Cupriavidus sp. U2]|uniref:T6SS immunity protein Tli4 family protein n=1 Tax=Cupriavidus sp. U2 TaxID=2920269 RepID=UPI00129E9C53|nr:T6SS immunity protein Tli4 family protein [Cupriavidus sp. U2]KAI3592622.1 hypothetical protein D9X30_2359 [Cupriavidus sp. U2]